MGSEVKCEHKFVPKLIHKNIYGDSSVKSVYCEKCGHVEALKGVTIED